MAAPQTQTQSPGVIPEAGVTTEAKVLLVDDRPDGLLALEAVLVSEAYNIIKVSSGPEALEAVSRNDFAVILLDVQMPGLDGFETAKLIREKPRSKEIPIIFITAISTDSHRIYKGYESGAVDFLFKPFDAFILRSKVSVFIDLFNKNQQIKHQARILREMELREKERQMVELEIESLRRYVDLADAIPNIVLKIKKDGSAEYFNQAWYQYTGIHNLLKGTDWQLVMHPADRKILFTFWRQYKKNNRRKFQMEGRIRSREGVYRWHLINVVAEERNDEVIGWIGTCIDIHELKVVEQKLTALAADLNRSNKDLEQFAYAASHDLKEPLHVVAGYAQLLNRRYKGKLDKDADEFIGYMLSGICRMQALIAELLNYSLIGRKESPFGDVNSQDCFQNAVSNLQTVIQETGTMISVDSLPVVWGNDTQITQLFQNLISNAIKFKGPSSPVIHIGTKKAEGGRWVFSVKDNGIGIKEEYFEKIFEVFRRLHSDIEYEGTGIGLATCKKIVERHNGKIWLESEVGAGSTFYFTLPAGSPGEGKVDVSNTSC